MQVQFTERSRNAKVGPMPVSTSSNETCPDACPLKRNGCYAEAGPLGMLWRSLSGATAGGTFTTGGKGVAKAISWEQFKAAIASLPEGTLWRHNQAGDLPGLNDAIDVEALRGLVVANQGKRGYTYTHKPVTGPHGAANVAAIRDANANGFTVNLSADNLSEADELAGERGSGCRRPACRDARQREAHNAAGPPSCCVSRDLSRRRQLRLLQALRSIVSAVCRRVPCARCI